MNNYQLKIIAITAMLIDHIGAIFLSPDVNYGLYLMCRSIGRIAFPIFVFLIVEGFYHTSNLKKYLLRLGVFALISEVPFDLAFYKYHYGISFLDDLNKAVNQPSHFKLLFDRLIAAQNVFFTLFLGLLLITLMNMVERRFNKNMTDYAIANSIDAVLVITICAASYVLDTDYSIAGILMIVAYFLFRGNITMLALSTIFIMGTMLCNWLAFFQYNNPRSIIAILAVLAIIPIRFYNGKKGKNIKYLFYAFYPVHLLLLFFIKNML